MNDRIRLAECAAVGAATPGDSEWLRLPSLRSGALQTLQPLATISGTDNEGASAFAKCGRSKRFSGEESYPQFNGGLYLNSQESRVAVGSHMRRRTWRSGLAALALAAGLMLGSVALAPSAAAGTRIGATNPHIVGQHASFDAQLIDYINQARTARGIPALREASGLTILSSWWSKKMSDGATGGNLQHNPTAWTDVTRYGASNRLAWGENVAKLPAGTSAKALFDAYMASPGHRANILSPKYHFIGMGTVGDAAWQYNTMEFTDQVQARTIINASR